MSPYAPRVLQAVQIWRLEFGAWLTLSLLGQLGRKKASLIFLTPYGWLAQSGDISYEQGSRLKERPLWTRVCRCTDVFALPLKAELRLPSLSGARGAVELWRNRSCLKMTALD
ncbi:hypothetical protein AOLI_G00006270 [Acnodon oligacanthus]